MTYRLRIPVFLVAFMAVAILAAAAPIHDAVRAGDAGRVKKLLATGPDSVNSVDRGETPLAIAVEKKDFRLIEMLVIAGATDKKALSGAYDIYAGKLRADPSGEGVNFIAGLMSYRLEDYGRGIMEFRRVLAANAGNASARAYTGLCYFSLEQYDQAEAAFRAAQQERLPKQVDAAVATYLERINAMTGWSVVGVASLGISHDSNVNVGPDHRTIDIAPITFLNLVTFNAIELADESLPQASYVAEASASVGLQRRIRSLGGARFFGRADYYQSMAPELSDYDIFLGQAVAGLRIPTSGKLWQVPVKVSHVEFGYEPLTTSYGIAPEMRCRVGQWGMKTTLSAEHQDWGDEEDRNGIYLAVTERGARSLGPYTIQLMAQVGHDVTKSDVYNRTGVKLGFTAVRKLPFRLTSVLAYTASIDEYDEPSVLETAARGDQGHDAMFALTRPFFGKARIALRHVHMTSTSSFDLYDYTRDITTLTTSVSF